MKVLTADLEYYKLIFRWKQIMNDVRFSNFLIMQDVCDICYI